MPAGWWPALSWTGTTRLSRKAFWPTPSRQGHQGRGRGLLRKGKTQALLDRLLERQDGVCRFMTNFDVPFDNSAAERDIRVLKVKQKSQAVCTPKREPKISRRRLHASIQQRNRAWVFSSSFLMLFKGLS